MILKTMKFREVNKFLNVVLTKEDFYKNSIYLDFNLGMAYVSSLPFNLKFSFEFELTEEERDKVNNLYVDSEVFLPTCNLIDSLEIDWGTKEISSKTAKISIPFLIEEMEIPDFNLSNYKSIDIDFTEDFFSKMKVATQFISDKAEDDLCGIFIRKNYMIGSNRRKFYNFKISDKSIEDVEFSRDVIKILSLCSYKDSIKIYNSENFVQVIINDFLFILISKKTNLNLPIDLFSDDFRKLYNHETSVFIKRQDLNKLLSFTHLYLMKSSDSRLFLKVTENKQLMGVIKEESKNVFSRDNYDCIEISDSLINHEFYINFNLFKLAIDCFQSDDIKIQISKNSGIITVTDGKNLDNFIIVVKMI